MTPKQMHMIRKFKNFPRARKGTPLAREIQMWRKKIKKNKLKQDKILKN